MRYTTKELLEMMEEELRARKGGFYLHMPFSAATKEQIEEFRTKLQELVNRLNRDDKLDPNIKYCLREWFVEANKVVPQAPPLRNEDADVITMRGNSWAN